MGLREQANESAGILRAMDGVATRAEQTGEPVTFPYAEDPPLPDLAGSGIPAEADVPVHVAWSRVMGDVLWLGKNRQARDYKYRGIDDVMDLVAPAVRKHGVVVIPIGAAPTYEIINTSKGSAMNYCRTVARFQVFGPRGDSFIGETPGEAFDNGDKSGTKAQSVALRTFYVQALSLATNRPENDPEFGEQHEIAGPRRPSAAEYLAEINDEGTSINRLRQIRAELDGDARLAHTTVEDLDGTPVELGRLVRRVGAARLEKRA